MARFIHFHIFFAILHSVYIKVTSSCERAATMYSLLGTVKLNGMNRENYLRHVLSVIADHPVNQIDELLP